MNRNPDKTTSRRMAGSRWRRTVFALFAVAAVAACSPVVDYRGYLPKSEDLQKIQIGQSKTEIQALLGSPSTTATIDRANDTYYYISSVVENFAFMKPKVVDREILSIRFDQDGRVADFGHYGLEDGKVVNFISRETPTRGKELTLLRQLFQNIGRFTPGAG